MESAARELDSQARTADGSDLSGKTGTRSSFGMPAKDEKSAFETPYFPSRSKTQFFISESLMRGSSESINVFARSSLAQR